MFWGLVNYHIYIYNIQYIYIQYITYKWDKPRKKATRSPCGLKNHLPIRGMIRVKKIQRRVVSAFDGDSRLCAFGRSIPLHIFWGGKWSFLEVNISYVLNVNCKKKTVNTSETTTKWREIQMDTVLPVYYCWKKKSQDLESRNWSRFDMANVTEWMVPRYCKGDAKWWSSARWL